MALMKMTGMAGVSSFSRASAMTPVCVSQRAPAGTEQPGMQWTLPVGMPGDPSPWQRWAGPEPQSWLCPQVPGARLAQALPTVGLMQDFSGQR